MTKFLLTKISPIRYICAHLDVSRIEQGILTACESVGKVDGEVPRSDGGHSCVHDVHSQCDGLTQIHR